MPKRKSLLKRVEVVVARRRRTCKHSRLKIAKGNICLVVYDGPRDCGSYSQETSLKMIADARGALDELEASLRQDSANTIGLLENRRGE